MKTRKNMASALSLILIVIVFGCRFVQPSDTTVSIFQPSSVSPAQASQQDQVPREQTIFSAESAINHPVPLPKDVLNVLTLDERTRRLFHWRDAREFSEAFSASEIDLNSAGTKGIVVQAINPRLLGANVDPFWVFQNTGKTHKLVLRTTGLGLEVLEKKRQGYRDIRVSLATAKELFTKTYKFDGRKYVEANSSKSRLGTK